jgi:hypothetical protein
MIKIIQTIFLTAVVFSPLSLIGLVTSATAHHSSSHVSTVATATTTTRKKRIKKGKKRTTSGTLQQKSTPDATNQLPAAVPSSESVPVKPNKPDISNPDKMNPSGVITPKPGSTEIPPAGSVVPNVPSVPSVPATGTPTVPTTLPTPK